MMNNFDLENKNGSMFLEPRTDGGIGIYADVNSNAKSVALALTKDEMLNLSGWLITYINNQRLDLPKASAQVKRNEDEYNRIWNSAIEAAALKAEEFDCWMEQIFEIRKLKK